MTNELTTTTPAETFRAKAAEAMILAANMSLHDLVDEFLRLTDVMDASVSKNEESGYFELSETGEIAVRDRKLIVSIARARFGLTLEPFDRPSSNSSSEW